MRRSGSRRKGTIERPSMLLSAPTPASSRIVGAMSICEVSSPVLVPGLIPGPLIRNGMWVAGS